MVYFFPFLVSFRCRNLGMVATVLSFEFFGSALCFLILCFSGAVPSARRDLLLGNWVAGNTTSVACRGEGTFFFLS